MISLSQTLLLLSTSTFHLAKSQQTWANLPQVPDGFNASARIVINASVQAVWDATLDWSQYPNWNPFVRKAQITDQNFNLLPLENQTLTEGAYATFSVQIPPLSLPVTAQTPDIWLYTQSSKENITHLQPEMCRVAWKAMMFPNWFMSSERWTGVSEGADGRAVWESREVFYGPGASLLKVLYAESLQKAFEAQAKGLKLWLERK